MKRYLIMKFYGHYLNIIRLDAKDEKDAIAYADNGAVMFSTILPHTYGNGAVAIEIPYCDAMIEKEYLEESIEMGMQASPDLHEFAFGLPFYTLFRMNTQKEVKNDT